MEEHKRDPEDCLHTRTVKTMIGGIVARQCLACKVILDDSEDDEDYFMERQEAEHEAWVAEQGEEDD